MLLSAKEIADKQKSILPKMAQIRVGHGVDRQRRKRRHRPAMQDRIRAAGVSLNRPLNV